LYCISQVPPCAADGAVRSASSTVTTSTAPAAATDDSVHLENFTALDLDLLSTLSDASFPSIYDPVADLQTQPATNLITAPSHDTDSMLSAPPQPALVPYATSPATSLPVCIPCVPSIVSVSPTRPSTLSHTHTVGHYQLSSGSDHSAPRTIVPLGMTPAILPIPTTFDTVIPAASVRPSAAAQPSQFASPMNQEFRFDHFNDFALLAYLYGIVRSPSASPIHSARLQTLETSFRQQLALDPVTFPNAWSADLSELLQLFEAMFFTHALIGRTH